jgi:uncharacterized membrane protein
MEGELMEGPGVPQRREAQGEQQGDAQGMIMGRWSGPLPPPAALEQFERASPGAADRILTMAEQEEKHRHELERMMVSSEIKARNRGQALGFAIAAITLIGGIWLVYSGKDWPGLVAILTPLVGLVGLFVYTQNQQDGDAEDSAR